LELDTLSLHDALPILGAYSRPGMQPQLTGALGGREQHRCRTVGDLGRVAGMHDAVWLERGLERPEPLDSRLPPDALILADHAPVDRKSTRLNSSHLGI